MKDYTPYGKKWKAELMKATTESLKKMFNIKHQKGESKSELIDRIKNQLKQLT